MMRTALIAVVASWALMASHAGAQRGPRAPQETAALVKDPQLATVLGLVIPGGGQIYAGRTVKGGILLTIAVAAPLLGVLGSMALDNHCCENRGGALRPVTMESAYEERGGRGERGRMAWGPVAAGVGGTAVAWAYGWVTAAGDARRTNAARGGSRVGAVIAPLPGGQTGVGLSIALR